METCLNEELDPPPAYYTIIAGGCLCLNRRLGVCVCADLPLPLSLASLNERAHLLTRVFRKTNSSVGRSNSVQQTVSRKYRQLERRLKIRPFLTDCDCSSRRQSFPPAPTPGHCAKGVLQVFFYIHGVNLQRHTRPGIGTPSLSLVSIISVRMRIIF